jgi:two-component system, LuxR family, response regulator FixJ
MPERSKKICVVDDDMSVLKSLGRLLDSAGLQMLLFNDPRLFLEHARNYAVAIAIIDVWMPQLDGLEVQRLLVDMVPATPVIMMTAMDNPGAQRVAFAQGAVAFFAKPFDDAAFLEAVLRALPASD